MLTSKPKQQICVLMSRALSEKRKSRAPPKPYKDRNPNFQKSLPFRYGESHRHGPTWDKTLTLMETRTLSYFDKHRNKVNEPYVVQERVSDISTVLPGVKVGPKFFDNYAGDTMVEGNEEASMISNFLHLTPPMIRAHTEELRTLCTPPPHKPDKGIRQYTTNYVFPGPSVQHPLSREASLRVSLSSLDLTEMEKEFVRDMVETMKMPTLKEIRHYEEFRLPKILRDLPVVLELKEDQLTIHSSQCPTRNQNLGLCYYRFSGFIREAKSLNPVKRDFHVPRIHLKFLFEQNEELMERFQEKHYVKFTFEDDDTADLSQLEGSEEAIKNVKRIIGEVTHDLVVKPLKLPSKYLDYLLNHSGRFKLLLEEYEANYIENTLVTYSDSLANVEEELTALIESLHTWQIECPKQMQGFALDADMRKSLMADFDVLTVDGASAEFVTVIGPSRFQEVVDGTVAAKILQLQQDMKTEEVPCSQWDINWTKVAKQFDVDVRVCKEDNAIRVTGEVERILELKSFLTSREANKRER